MTGNRDGRGRRAGRLVTGPGLALLLVLAACSKPEVPRIVSNGSLPRGADARFVMLDDPAADGLLASAAVTDCLASMGLNAGAAPGYAAQYAVAVRPAASALRLGAAAAATAPRPRGRQPRGERIRYVLTLDRLSDGARVYEASVEAPFRAKRSSAAARADQFCAAIRQTGAQPS